MGVEFRTTRGGNVGTEAAPLPGVLPPRVALLMTETGVVTTATAPPASEPAPAAANVVSGIAAGLLTLVVVGAAPDRWVVFAVAAAAALVVATRARMSWCSVPAAPIVAAAAWLFRQTVEVPLLAAIGLAFGLAVGVLAARKVGDRVRRVTAVVIIAAGTTAVAIVIVDRVFSTHAALLTGSVVAVLIALVSVVIDAPARRAPNRSAIVALMLSILLTASATFWIGANAATATWFGALTYHGSRNSNEVAVTFDDGPNATTTLALQRILDHYGVKATFFEVGKAVAARPDISRALVADGQLLGNHSYHHDSWRWLDPRYPELARTQNAIDRFVGVCPTYYRPPHGQHTPLMAAVIHSNRMKMVTWDDSTSDWTTTDGNRVARRILAKVKPGSIIDLHDGLDGRVNVDRTVLVRALPLILDGLRARGLHPVRLDVLLGDRPYAGQC
jgi:peptidoglycan-N-acetylglucosamine deacetylase